MADSGTRNNVLFISHNAADRPYAVALEAAIHELVESKTLIDVRYSTSDAAGPQGGDQWREWIYSQVIAARTALIVVTPHALGKPWLLWEAGACWGAALAQKAVSSAGPATTPPADGADAENLGTLGRRLNVSIAYGLTEAECPDPLRGNQIIAGADAERMSYLLQRILQVHALGSAQLIQAGQRMQGVLKNYLEKVRTALLKAPSLVTEANVQDWLSRLDTLVRSDRRSELKSFQRWMTLAFGRDGEAAGVPIDVRLHRRLGELYLADKEFALAAEQLDLARRAAPRDIYVLRPLAEVSMKRLLADPAASQVATARKQIESKQIESQIERERIEREQIELLLEAIKDLDDQAFVANPDAAALRGKYLRRVKEDREQAIATYAAALRANPDSYYLADLLAQTELEVGRPEDAKASFRNALEIVDRLREDSVWSHATAATACIALDHVDEASRRLAAIAQCRPVNKSERDTIANALREIAKRFGVADPVVEDLLRIIATE